MDQKLLSVLGAAGLAYLAAGCSHSATKDTAPSVKEGAAVQAVEPAAAASGADSFPVMSDAERTRRFKSLEKLILSFKPYTFNEESQKGFANDLIEMRSRPENRRAPGTYLFVVGDGTFGIREFFWDPATEVMKVRFAASAGDRASMRVYHRTAKGWGLPEMVETPRNPLYDDEVDPGPPPNTKGL